MNDQEIILVIIFNHKYNQNIEKLRSIYKNRFSTIYFLVPFYEGNDADVIPVYEHSFQFQGYIAQGFKHFKHETAKHYLCIGDDLLLHPSINQFNYKNYFKVTNTDCFIPSLLPINEIKTSWLPMLNIFQLNLTQKGLEIKNELPTYSEALQKLQKHKVNFKNKISLKAIFGGKNKLYFWSSIIRKKILKKALFQYEYPMAMSYSDLVLVDAITIQKFVHYCGVFASANLFVEAAIPTSLAIACNNTIVTEKDLEQKGMQLWTEKDMVFLQKYNFSLQELLQNFDANCLYIHPIKLSKWH